MNIYPSETIIQSGNIKEIVCKENGRSFYLKNKSKFYINKIKVDGKLIKKGIRCDYAVDVNNQANISDCIYLIELKGSDKSHACEQILQTYIYFNDQYETKNYNCRIVLSKDNAPKLLSTEYKKLLQLEKQKKINLIIKSQKIEETIWSQ